MARNGGLPSPPPPTQNSNCTILSILSKEKLTGPNYMDLMRNLKMTFSYENNKYVLEILFLEINSVTATI